MNFLMTQNVGANSSGINIYITPVDNTSFVSSNGKFKAVVEHGMNTNNLIVQIDDGDTTELTSYKYKNDNEIEIYWTAAEDVTVKVFGLQKIETGSLSIVGVGVLGKIVLGKNN